MLRIPPLLLHKSLDRAIWLRRRIRRYGWNQCWDLEHVDSVVFLGEEVETCVFAVERFELGEVGFGS